MLPILIMPDSPIELAEEILAEPSDSATALTDLYEIEEIRELVAHALRRGRATLGPWVEIRQRVPAVTQSSDAAPASLQDCDQFLKLLLRRKAESMPPLQRTELRRVMQTTGLAPASIATLSPQTATWLLWAMSWRGVSTPRQLVCPPLHGDAGRAMVDQHADEAVLRAGRFAATRVRGLRRAAIRILVAIGDTQTGFDSGYARLADGQNQIHAGDAGDEFHDDDREFAREKVLHDLGMREFAQECHNCRLRQIKINDLQRS